MVDEACRQEGSPVSVDAHDLPVECPASLLEEICEAALAESVRQPHVAVEFNGELFGKNLDINYLVPFRHRRAEVCGVLFGSREETRVQLRDFRRLVMEGDFERSATLSDQERQALVALIAEAKADPELPGLEPVGWLRADPKSHLTLSKRDLEIFQYFFNEPWQIALILRPGRSAPAKARFFLREANGSICPASCFRVVLVSALVESPIVRVERQASAREVEGAGRAAPEIWRPRRLRMPAITLSSFSWILGVVLALGYWWIKSSPQTSLPDTRKHAPAAKAPADGQEKVAQDAAALWKKWEEELRKRQEIAALTEKLEKRTPAETETPEAPKERRVETSKEKEPQDQRRKEPLSKPLEPPRTAAAIPPKPVAPVSAGGKQYRLPQPAAAPPAAQKKVMAQVLTPPPRVAHPQSPSTPPPQLAHQEAPATPPPQEQSPLPSPPAQPAPVLAAAKNPAAPSPTMAVAPTSGRLIWTGHLQKNQTLIIDGAKASTGSFSGELPGQPIQFKILPGELADDGIVMYTPNAQGASAMYESPGPQNGWNKTLYTLNARRAAEILLVEPPGPQNAWKRLVLRSKSQKASVIMVEWTVSR